MAAQSDSQAMSAPTPSELHLEKGEDAPAISASPVDPLLISWDTTTSPTDPYTYSQPRKWFITLLTSLGGLVTLMSGAMLAPALHPISSDLHISEAEVSMALSIFILAFAFGPLVLAPCSEVWGRRVVWIAGGAWYVLWNTLCGVARGKGLMIAGRLMAGLGASAEFAVSGPIVADIWPAEQRGKSQAIRGFIPLIGPALGPIVGGVMVQQVDWRWLFYAMSILSTIITLLFILFLPETHRPTLLARHAAQLRKSTGQPYYAEHESGAPSLSGRLKVALIRPIWMLYSQPTIQLCSLMMGVQFGLLYIALSTFSTLWTNRYDQSPTASGLHYLALVVGYTVALQVGGWATDRIWARLKAKNSGETKAEYRVPMMIPGAMLVPVGLLWYGWAAEKHLHWIIPDIGIAVFGCGYIIGGTATQSYVVEAFLEYTASAGAASMLLRNIFAFAFPIFAPALYASLGYGIGNTILAAMSIALGIPAPFILWRYGARLRKKGGVVS